MLANVLSVLRCPAHPADIEEPLDAQGDTLRCSAGHSFDIAGRRGYVNLAVRDPKTGDSADMVRARDAWLDRGHYAAVSDRVAAIARMQQPTVIVDAGAGTGHYLAAALDEAAGAVGLALDLSRYAARVAARKHPRIGAVVADVWSPLPARSGCADLVLDVFAPRNGPEFARILRPDGVLVVATPAPHHLAELAAALGMLSVDQDKRERLDRSLEPTFIRNRGGTERLEYELRLSRTEAAELAGMGPSAWHLEPDQVVPALAKLPEPIVLTVAIDISCWVPRQP